MKTLFVGNRGGVLAEMLKVTEVVGIGVMADTYLERDPILDGREYKRIASYTDLLMFVNSSECDIVISNGLSLIIKTKDFESRRIVNIHPSFLPDLRGIDPVLGSILFKRDAGATCHEIDDGIDTGPVISQVRIPYSDDFNASLLYQLSFRAEALVFREALERNFEVDHPQEVVDDVVYFSRRSNTRVLPFSEGVDACLRVVRAFDNRNQGARFFVAGSEFQTHSAWVIDNTFMREQFREFMSYQIVMVFEDTIVVKIDNLFLLLSEVPGAATDLVGLSVEGR